jgi:hypothetical protein
MLILAAAVMMLAPVGASAARVFVRGGFYGGGFYAPYWGPYWGPYAYWGPYGEVYYPNSGQVKLDTKVKDALVFINGAYAGTTHDNKTMHLRAGSYKIEIRAGGAEKFSETVMVTAGKTIHINPGL